MIATGLAIIVLVLAFEVWLPLAFIFGTIKLLVTFSLSAAWEAFKSVPIWIWEYVHSTMS